MDHTRDLEGTVILFVERAKILFGEMSLGAIPDAGIIEEWYQAASTLLEKLLGKEIGE